MKSVPVVSRALFLISLTAIPAATFAEPLVAFSSDGCSQFPNGTQAQPDLWLDCCMAHDAAYWAGGTADQRALADQALQQCVAAKQQASVGALMLMGVRIGGTPFMPTPFRWGFGWPLWRGYTPLSTLERIQVRQGWPAGIALPAYLTEDAPTEISE